MREDSTRADTAGLHEAHVALPSRLVPPAALWSLHGKQCLRFGFSGFVYMLSISSEVYLLLSQDLKGSLLIVPIAVALAAFLFGIEVLIPHVPAH